MARIQGITIEKDTLGNARYARIDLHKYGDNELIEDFFDSLEVESRKNDETITVEELKKYIQKREKAEK
jgi:hypothetical protein